MGFNFDRVRYSAKFFISQKKGLINLPYKMNQQFSFITSSFLRLIKDKF